MGWEALCRAMRSWGISSREDLSEWIGREGFPQPRWGAHFSGRAQERILSRAANLDGRVAMLEGLYVLVTLHCCRRGLPPEQPGRSTGFSHRCVDPTPFETSSWDDVDGMCFERVYDSRFRVLQSCPHHLRGRFRKACRQVLERRHEGVQAGDDVKETRSWKMFCLLPFMLLRRPAGEGRVGKAELCRRFDQFSEGQWKRLYEEGFRDIRSENTRRPVSTLQSNEQRGQAALQKVRLGEVSRARQCLVGAALAPGTEETLAEMQNKRPQVVFRELTEEVLNYEPDVRVTLDRKLLLQSLRTAPRGSSPGPGGFTYEHARVLSGRFRHFRLVGGSPQQFGQRSSACRGVCSAHACQTDCLEQARRRGSWDSDGNNSAAFSRKDVGQTVCESVRGRVFSFPICTLYQSWYRLRGAHDSCNHRQRSHSNRVEGGWHRRVRSCVPRRHVAAIGQHGRRPCHLAVCQVVIREPVQLPMVQRGWRVSHSDPS